MELETIQQARIDREKYDHQADGCSGRQIGRDIVGRNIFSLAVVFLIVKLTRFMAGKRLRKLFE